MRSVPSSAVNGNIPYKVAVVGAALLEAQPWLHVVIHHR